MLPTQQAAQAFAQRVRGGTSFVEAAGPGRLRAGDVTFADQRREQFADATNPEIAAAAFAAAQGTVAGPIRSPLGFHVVRVERITARRRGRSKRCAATSPARSSSASAASALNALIRRIEEQIAEGASVEEAARAGRPHPRHHAADHRDRASAAASPPGSAPAELTAVLAARSRSTPTIPSR